jgi:hypothetical protein
VPLVGHGQTGLRSNLRIFDQHKNESSCRTDAFVEIEGGALIQDAWDPTGGAAGFEYPWDQDGVDGEKLDVSSVSAIDFPNLTRAETQAVLEATESTWQYDMEEGVLRVHLPSNADPSDLRVRVTSAVCNVSTGGEIREHMTHPYLGTDQITDGDFDESGIPDWVDTTTGSGFSAVRSATPLVGGGYSALLAGTGAGSGSVTITQQPDSANGKRRWLTGYYSTPADQPSTAHLYVRVGTTTQLQADGINTEALGDGLELTATHGRTRFFIFDFINHEADVEIAFKLENSAATACSATIDRVRQKPVHGWRFFTPRVAPDGIPESEQGSLDVYPGSASTGSGAVKLLNDETAPFERMFSGSPWTCLSRDVRIRYGGTFSDNGQEIIWEDMFLGQSGIVAGEQFELVTDESATYTFEDLRNPFEALLPDRFYGDTFDCEERDKQRPRARFFGPQTHIRPCRIDVDGTTGLGVYEVNDPTYAIGAAFGDATVYAYVDEEAAEANDATKRVTLTNSTDYTVDTATGTFEINRNPGIFVITSGQGPENDGANDRIDFTRNGTPAVAALTPGNYTSRTLEVMANAAMLAAGSGGTVTYSNTTHKYTIADPTATTLDLNPNAGPNAHRDGLKLMGFTDSDDATYTGALTYASDTAVFVGPDEQNFLRCDFTAGYCDDAAGTYTGTTNNPVELGPDIFRYALHEMQGVPTSRVDMASFLTARTDCPQVLGVYFGVIASVSGQEGGQITVQQFVDRLEVSGTSEAAGLADIILRGDGVWTWKNRATIPEPPVALYSRDFLSFSGSRNGSDPYGITRVNYSQDPSTGIVLSTSVRNEDTILRDGRAQTRVFDGYFTDLVDADSAINALVALTRTAIRRFRFTAAGSLLGADPGSLVEITRGRALQGTGETGGLDADEFRILYIKKNYLTRVVEVETHTNIIS